MLTKEELKNQLRAMGIQSTDTVMIHTSMKAIGEVEGGAEELLDGFCEYLADGLLLVPTHTWEEVTQDNPYYDVRTSVPNIGVIPRTAAFRKDGVRSLHPTHSLWAKGNRAEEYVANEENADSPAATGFCWDKLADWNGKILLIGVGNDKNTFIHSVEDRAQLPDRMSQDFYEVQIVDWAGNVLKKPMHYLECSKTEDISLFYGIYDEPMVKTGVQTFGRLGNAQVRIVDAMGCRKLLMTIFSRAAEDIFTQHIRLPEELYR